MVDWERYDHTYCRIRNEISQVVLEEHLCAAAPPSLAEPSSTIRNSNGIREPCIINRKSNNATRAKVKAIKRPMRDDLPVMADTAEFECLPKKRRGRPSKQYLMELERLRNEKAKKAFEEVKSAEQRSELATETPKSMTESLAPSASSVTKDKEKTEPKKKADRIRSLLKTPITRPKSKSTKSSPKDEPVPKSPAPKSPVAKSPAKVAKTEAKDENTMADSVPESTTDMANSKSADASRSPRRKGRKTGSKSKPTKLNIVIKPRSRKTISGEAEPIQSGKQEKSRNGNQKAKAKPKPLEEPVNEGRKSYKRKTSKAIPAAQIDKSNIVWGGRRSRR